MMGAASDELRRLLDERGVEWEMPISIMSHIKTVWRSGSWEYTAIETSGGEFSVYAEHRDWITPEQAVDATLGRKPSRITREPDSDHLWYCENCGRYHEHHSEFPWEFCPRCGSPRLGTEVGE